MAHDCGLGFGGDAQVGLIKIAFVSAGMFGTREQHHARALAQLRHHAAPFGAGRVAGQESPMCGPFPAHIGYHTVTGYLPGQCFGNIPPQIGEQMAAAHRHALPLDPRHDPATGMRFDFIGFKSPVKPRNRFGDGMRRKPFNGGCAFHGLGRACRCRNLHFTCRQRAGLVENHGREGAGAFENIGTGEDNPAFQRGRYPGRRGQRHGQPKGAGA